MNVRDNKLLLPLFDVLNLVSLSEVNVRVNNLLLPLVGGLKRRIRWGLDPMSRVYAKLCQGYVKGLSRVYVRGLKRIIRWGLDPMPRVYVNGVSRVCQGSVKGLCQGSETKNYVGFGPDVKGLCQGSVKGLPRVCQGAMSRV